MKLRVLYFASMRDVAGSDAEAVTTQAASARDLYAELRERHAFALDATSLRVAINGAFAQWDSALHEGDEVVFLPPVSGG